METTDGEARPVAQVDRLWKSYGGVPVLSDVHITLQPGEIHALVGGNGAGKSTLMKCVTGAVPPDTGEIIIDGTPIRNMSLRQAHANGVYMVPQEPQLFGHLSVYENITLGLAKRPSRTHVTSVIAQLSAPLDLDAPALELSISNQQLVELVRGIMRQARLLIVDEPTAALTAHEVEMLFTQLRALAASGVGIFYVSHRLNEIFALCDTVSVLRDGKVVLQGPTASFSREQLVSAIAPDTAISATHSKREHPTREPVLSVRHLSGQGFANISFDLHPGEILGIAGVVGAGRTELVDTIYGLRPGAGEVVLAGAPFPHRTPAKAIKRHLAYVPEDRHAHGVFLGATVPENISVSVAGTLATLGIIHSAAEHNVAAALSQSLSLQKGAADRKVAALSGGNQQKIALAKALACDPLVLILDEPSRGVDVGARSDLYRLIDALAAKGLAVLLISSDFEEIVELSTRVLIMREGRITGELTATEITFASVRDGAFLPESAA